MTASQHHQWTHMSGTAGNDVCVRVSMHRNGDPGQPNGVVLSAATSVWLPVASDHVFAFVRDESTRSQVPVLSTLCTLSIYTVCTLSIYTVCTDAIDAMCMSRHCCAPEYSGTS
jgi:hypothetical protein